MKKKIVFVSCWYTEKFGYINNCLPVALSKLGYDVHIVTSNTQQYFNDPIYADTYEEFLGPGIIETGITKIGDLTVHRLPYKLFKTEVHMSGLYKTLKSIKPNIVHIFNVDSVLTFKLATYQLLLGYSLFASNHLLLSVFPLAKQWRTLSLLKKTAWNLKHYLPGKFISSRLTKVINPSEEGTEIASTYFGIDRKKCSISPLGVDTSVFKPNRISRKKIREELNLQDHQIVCIYTGRFSPHKNPQILAEAIEIANKSSNRYIGIFIGNGIQKETIESISNCRCFEFMPHSQLSDMYNASDIAVWPREESTSMLDAAGCGIPIVVSDKTLMKERYEGNGLTYSENSPSDLAKQLLKLESDTLRTELGSAGELKIKENYSWDSIAQERIKDYFNDVN